MRAVVRNDQTDGTSQGPGDTHDMAASDTLTRGRSRSSFNLMLSSVKRRSFNSAMFCFLFFTSPPGRSSYAAGIMRK